MRRLLWAVVAAVLSVGVVDEVYAQQGSPDAAALRLFASGLDINALIAKAKAERKPDQANFVQPVVRVPPYTLNLEYRMSGVKAGASAHDTEAEIFFVIEGTGTAITGGRLRDEARSNPENRTGTGIDGGESRKLVKGDVLFVPEGSPHWFDAENGALVLLSLHVPRPVR